MIAKEPAERWREADETAAFNVESYESTVQRKKISNDRGACL